ncbi:MAG: hypothetical protein ABI886_04325 [Betaproteobacteria bacterium]
MGTAAALVVGTAFAAHPLLTEDAGTQGQGKFELELGAHQVRNGGSKAFEFRPQLPYGIVDTLLVGATLRW